MDSENMNQIKNLMLKRSTKAAVGCLITLTGILVLLNSSETPRAFMPEASAAKLEGHVEKLQGEKIQKVVLEELTLQKDPKVVYHREAVLNDFENRISKDFDIPAGLRDRVGFWFDIYTQYDSHNRVIHHVKYPWIIFKVVDVTSIIESSKPKARWMRNMKADDHVAEEMKRVRLALKALSGGKAVNKNNPYEVMVAKALQPLKGTLKNKALAAEVRVQTGQKNFFANGLKSSPKYLGAMEEIFRSHRLPTELTRLPFVESSFNLNAVSKVGASGIWQFMSYTGKSFMTVNEYIDERNSPFKATQAAARLLKENHMILKRDWSLAVSAWNHGPGGIRRAMKAAGSDDLAKIIERYQSKTFDFASSNFFCSFLAALHAEKYHDQIFPEIEDEKPLEVHAVKLAQGVKAKELFKRSGLTKEDFIMLNPDLKRALDKNHTIPRGFSLIVEESTRFNLRNLLTKDTRQGDMKTKIGQGGVSFNNDLITKN